MITKQYFILYWQIILCGFILITKQYITCIFRTSPVDVIQMAFYERLDAGPQACHGRSWWENHHQNVWETRHHPHPCQHSFRQLSGRWLPLLDVWCTPYWQSWVLLRHSWKWGITGPKWEPTNWQPVEYNWA